MNKLTVLICMFAFCAIPVAAQDAGTVEGIVLDSSGRPVSNAVVYAASLAGYTYIPKGLSDQRGHYSIQGLSWGEYALSASKRDDAFPNSSDVFYSGRGTERPPAISLIATQPVAIANVKLGKRAGWLIGKVSDAETGKLIDTTCAKLRWKSDSSIWIEGSGFIGGNFHYLIPSDTPLSLTVWSWGYKPWYSDGSLESSLRVREGKRKKVAVRLVPIKPRREPTEKELLMMKSVAAQGVCGAGQLP